jgi:cellobiose-specific phosphotransferase system component IIB
MARVLLVCVAGVSGTFLGRRMRALDPALEPVVAPVSALPADASSSDAVLVAPQLAADLEEVRRRVAPAPVAVLPPTAFAAGGAEAAVTQARDLLAARSYVGPETTETKE